MLFIYAQKRVLDFTNNVFNIVIIHVPKLIIFGAIYLSNLNKEMDLLFLNELISHFHFKILFFLSFNSFIRNQIVPRKGVRPHINIPKIVYLNLLHHLYRSNQTIVMQAVYFHYGDLFKRHAIQTTSSQLPSSNYLLLV